MVQRIQQVGLVAQKLKDDAIFVQSRRRSLESICYVVFLCAGFVWW